MEKIIIEVPEEKMDRLKKVLDENLNSISHRKRRKLMCSITKNY
jgi:hypothetical protein